MKYFGKICVDILDITIFWRPFVTWYFFEIFFPKIIIFRKNISKKYYVPNGRQKVLMSKISTNIFPKYFMAENIILRLKLHCFRFFVFFFLHYYEFPPFGKSSMRYFRTGVNILKPHFFSSEATSPLKRPPVVLRATFAKAHDYSERLVTNQTA